MITTTQSSDLRYTIHSHDIDDNSMTIKIRLNDECNNGHQDFAITAHIFQKGKPHIDRYLIMGGCCHDEILATNPELKIFIDLHLCDYKGIPMHAVANGFYHLRNGFNDQEPKTEKFKAQFCSHYRVTSAQFDALDACENQIQYALALQNLGILNQWEAQANEAISILEGMTSNKFIVDSVKTNYIAPTAEDIKEEENKQASGYYTPKAKAEREKKIKAKFRKSIVQKYEKKISELNAECDIELLIFDIGGKAAVDNFIYYTHTKQIAFNWRGYDEIDEALISKIKAEIKLPNGVTFR